MKEKMIELKNVCKTYKHGNQKMVLKDLNLEVEKGEMVAILGKSGSGKTTLLQILGLMKKKDSGEYRLDGKILDKKRDSELARLRNEKIGSIFQDFKLIDTLSAKENISVPLFLRGYRENECEESVEELAEQFEIEEVLETKVKELSGGEKQRVAIARAIIGNPDVLLADEPTGALDSDTAQQIMDIFKRLQEQGKTILIVTHDRKIAKQCNRILYLRDGILEEHGEP